MMKCEEKNGSKHTQLHKGTICKDISNHQSWLGVGQSQFDTW